MRKLGFILLLILFVSVSCDLNKVEEPKQVYAIKNYSDYDSIGVATVGVGSSSSRSVAGEKVLIGIKNGLIEQLEFLDEGGNPLQVTLRNDVCETQNFMFLSFTISNGENSTEQKYCLHKPSGNIFPINFYIYSRLPNDMFEDCGDVIYSNTNKISYKNKQLTLESYVVAEASRLFTFFLVDKYGNIYSTSDAEYKGKMITSAGKLLTIPSNYEYRLGENGRVYYWVSEVKGGTNHTTRGYFSENGEMIDISEDDFFPAFKGQNQESTMGRWTRDFTYINGNDSYHVYWMDDGSNWFFQDILHVHFNNDSSDSYTEETYKMQSDGSFYMGTIDGCKFKQVVDKYLYLLNDNMLFRIDMTTGNFEVISNSYSYYVACEYLGNEDFRLTVVDENQNKILVGVDGNGNAIELSKEKGTFSSITISPILRMTT